NNGSFTLEYKGESVAEGKLILYSSIGDKVGEYIVDPSSDKMTIVNSELKDGVYLYRMFAGNNIIKTGRIVVIK
ncbi:MAG TPA: hypothetical protein VNX68_12925, partial [Nitrosopumilaceae archaeon]|nr:hypothetical protein [Nitrosopumilaceae archaeon]